MINAVSDGQVYNCYLPNVDRVSTFWKVMEQFCDNLRCCSNLISGFELQSKCPQCGRRAQAKTSTIQNYPKRPASNQADKRLCISSTPDSTAATSTDLSVAKSSVSSESPKRRRIDSGRSYFHPETVSIYK